MLRFNPMNTDNDTCSSPPRALWSVDGNRIIVDELDFFSDRNDDKSSSPEQFDDVSIKNQLLSDPISPNVNVSSFLFLSFLLLDTKLKLNSIVLGSIL